MLRGADARQLVARLGQLEAGHEVGRGVVDRHVRQGRCPRSSQGHGPLVEQDAPGPADVVGHEREELGRAGVRLEVDTRMHVVGRVIGRHALVNVGEEVRHGVTGDGHHDVAGPCRPPVLSGHHARARCPARVGRAQQHGRGGVCPGQPSIQLPQPVGAHPRQVRRVRDHAPMLVSTASRRGPHSKNVGTFS